MHSFKSSTVVQPFIRTPSCQVCLEPYDGGEHVPKILQCAHTICESCVNVLEEQSRRGSSRSSNQPIINISCPVCRAPTHTPRGCVRTNYQLIDVVDGIRGEANHNVVFVSCIECQGVYHEKDVNICTNCSPIKSSTTAVEMLDSKINLSSFGVCSTCLMKDHMSKGHSFIRLQPLRVEMQRQENLRRIVLIQDKLARTQHSFRERLNSTIDRWIKWSSNHDIQTKRFQEATDSFNQKKVYDEFVNQMTKKQERIEQLMKNIQRWSEELQNEIPPPIPARPQNPVQLERQEVLNTPHEPLGPNYAYYFED